MSQGEISSVLWNDGPPDAAPPGPAKNDMNFFATDYSQQGDAFTPGHSYSTPSYSGGIDEFEKPLLEELGIDFLHIKRKAKIVCNPFKPCMDARILQDADLAGPLFMTVAMGCVLLLTGKVHFGYIFGMGMFGCLCLYSLLNVMTDKTVDLQYIVSVLGYCLAPVLILTLYSTLKMIGINFPSWLGYPIGMGLIAWASWCATKMFVEGLGMSEQKWLILYPITLLYSTFALISIF